jgi:hypothetical protein
MNASLNRSTSSYLFRETILIILLGYFLLIGGTLNGLVQFRLNVISTALIAIIAAAWMGCRLYRRPGLAHHCLLSRPTYSDCFVRRPSS